MLHYGCWKGGTLMSLTLHEHAILKLNGSLVAVIDRAVITVCPMELDSGHRQMTCPGELWGANDAKLRRDLLIMMFSKHSNECTSVAG